MESLALVAADQVDLDTLTLAFNSGFTNYFVPLTQTSESLATLIETNDVSLADSVVAREPSGAPAGIGLLAVRGRRGWVAGMGVAPAWRRRAQGEAIMRELIARCRSRGVRVLQLEVLEQNEPARRLYQRLHFIERRHLLIYSGPLASRSGPLLPGPGLSTGPLDAAEALSHFETLHAVAPSWQRESQSLARMVPRLSGLGLWEGHALAAYVLHNEQGAGLPVLDAGARATTPQQRAAYVEILLRMLVAGRSWMSVRAINVPPRDPLNDALWALRCPVGGGQWEMTLDLTS
jgi:ribosomal protein S18 acetylase RimI-like enzyme